MVPHSPGRACLATRLCSNIRRSGFTLLELLVVIAIIAVFIALLLPALERARAAAQNVACQSQLRQLSMAVYQYQNDNDGRYPVVARHTSDRYWHDFYLADYFGDKEALRCPADDVSADGKPTYAPLRYGSGAWQRGNGDWESDHPVNVGGRVRVYDVRTGSGALNKSRGVFGPVDKAGDPFPDNPYMVEYVGMHWTQMMMSSDPGKEGAMQFPHPERAMNYLTATLGVRHAEFAGVPDADFLQHAFGIGGPPKWNRILVGHRGENKLPHWPYETLTSAGTRQFRDTGER